MKKSFKIALVGRPNVGKSALFNRIIKKRLSIVEDIEGITRDRLYAKAELFGKTFEMIDTGGLSQDKNAPFHEEIQKQTRYALEEADSIIFVIDGRIGVTALDEEVAKMLLRTKKPVCLAVNKIDNLESFQAFPYYGLGIEKIIPVSAMQGNHIVELLDEALKTYDEKLHIEVEEPAIKVAIIGRPNVGKSTLLNNVLGDHRAAVSNIAGTTRDSIDAPVTIDDTNYVLIDTAGIRKKKSEKEVVDKFAFIRTENAIERADICLLMFDGTVGLSVEEKRILQIIEEAGKGCILLANKWDLVKAVRMEHCRTSLHIDCPFSENLPLLFISAKSGRNLSQIFNEVKKLYEAQNKTITTADLNKFMEKAMQRVHPPMIQGKRLRIYYLTQISKSPLMFKFFVNKKELLPLSYRKYIINQFREQFNIQGCPIRFKIQSKVDRRAPAKT